MSSFFFLFVCVLGYLATLQAALDALILGGIQEEHELDIDLLAHDRLPAIQIVLFKKNKKTKEKRKNMDQGYEAAGRASSGRVTLLRGKPSIRNLSLPLAVMAFSIRPTVIATGTMVPSLM